VNDDPFVVTRDKCNQADARRYVADLAQMFRTEGKRVEMFDRGDCCVVYGENDFRVTYTITRHETCCPYC